MQKEKIGELDSSLRQAEIKLHSFHEQTIELQSTKIHMEDLSQQNSHLQTEKSSLEEKLQHVEQAFAQTSKDLQEAKDKVKEYETSHVPSHEVDELLVWGNFHFLLNLEGKSSRIGNKISRSTILIPSS